MPRVTPVSRPQDYPGTPDDATARDLVELFAALFPGIGAPAFDAAHEGLAIAAHAPKLALALARMSGLIAGELGWSQRKDLRELAIQALSWHLRCPYQAASRRAAALAAGLSAELLDALPDWQHSPLFDAEQRLTVEYTLAVITTSVSDELFAQVEGRFGTRGAVEFTSLVSFWAFWAMFLSATGAGG